MIRLFTMLLAMCTVAAVNGQFTYIWGGEGDPNSEFDGGLNDWTTLTIMDGDTVAANWVWEADGKADDGTYAGDNAINSPSIDNGAMVFDADYYTTVAGFPSTKTAYLNSPVMDCSGEDEVTLVFNQYARRFLCSYLVEVTNDGENWVTYTVNPALSTNSATVTNQIELIDISAVAANQAEVQIRFIFTGSYYFWVLDDVALVQTPDSDIRMTNAFQPTLSRRVPSYALEAQDMTFGCVIENYIGDVPATATVTARIHDGDTDEVLWEASQEVPNLTNDGDPAVQDSVFFDEMLSGAEMAEIMTEEKLYYTTYTVTSDGGDFFFDDNIFTFNYEITADEFNQTVSTNGVGWDNDLYTIANFYKTADIPAGYRLRASQLGAGYSVQNGTLLQAEIDVRIYEVEDGVDEYLEEGWNFDVIFPEVEALTEVGYSFAELVDVPEQDELFMWDLEDSETFDTLFLDGNTMYFTAVGLTRLDPTTTGIHYAFCNGSIDPGTRYVSLVDVGGSNGWPGRIWNMPFTVILEMDPNSTVEPFAYDALNVFPNPASNVVNLDIDLDQASDKVAIVITDIAGKIAYSETYYNFKSGTKTLNIDNLPAGNYVLNMLTDKGYQTEKITVVK